MGLNHTQASAHVDVCRLMPVCQVIVRAGKNNRPAVNSRKRRPGQPRSTQLFNSGSDIKHIKQASYVSAQYLLSPVCQTNAALHHKAKIDTTLQELVG